MRSRPSRLVGTDKQFTGHQKEGDLYFMKARFYDPAVGRFLQPDSVVPDYADPQSLNRYSYVYNNPLAYADPTGHYGVPFYLGTADAAICAALGENMSEQYYGACGIHRIGPPLFMGGSSGTMAVTPAQAMAALGLYACALTPCDELIGQGLQATGHIFGKGIKGLGCNGLFCFSSSNGGGDADKPAEEILGEYDLQPSPTSGRTDTLPKDQLDELFERLTKGAKPVTAAGYPQGRMWERPDGTRVGKREDDGGIPTLDIHNPSLPRGYHVKGVGE